MELSIKTQFEQAIKDAEGLRERPSNDTLLLLYSLFKQATEGDNPNNPPDNPFDFVARAKYEAWVNLKGKAPEVAMKEYVELVEKLKS